MKNLINRVRSSGNTFTPALMASAVSLVELQLGGATSAEKAVINYAGVARDLLPQKVRQLGGDFRRFALAEDRCVHVITHWMNNEHPVTCSQLADALDAIDYLTGRTRGSEDDLKTLCHEVERAL